MTSLVTKATIGLAAIGTTLAFAAPADAQRYHRYRHHRDNGGALVAGIAGIAIGAAIASGDRRYDYDRRYYRQRGYYPNNGYYYRDNYRRYNGYRNCYTRRVWDPYEGRRVRVRYCD